MIEPSASPFMSALALEIPGPVARAVDAWREVYDPHVGLIDPHVTLIYPPFVAPQDWRDLKPALVELLESYLPFTLVLKETGAFTSEQFVLWLKPEEGGVLPRLRSALEERFPRAVLQLPYDFIPHVTLGFFPDEAALRQAQARVQNELEGFTFEANSVVYAAQEDGQNWRIFDRIILGG